MIRKKKTRQFLCFIKVTNEDDKMLASQIGNVYGMIANVNVFFDLLFC